ncbi:hypothetical protein COCCADRAFT_80701 [Bipolaris zeicola 26-R-13]|uniref:Uncharacterized protein n=1 Tax=Cochliobolus carbonum (strain 26-R-13) TaxID=930089 RepID=W6YJ14_COCC2|nr:uncharacterized protein COCCADRAFT_80701 [Bipolaris zeicola 26-R-13]EUC39332.1 hypothetical protein COCCADRAFT_80701 [Bipolaris zeicola 26-R-13]
MRRAAAYAKPVWARVRRLAVWPSRRPCVPLCWCRTVSSQYIVIGRAASQGKHKGGRGRRRRRAPSHHARAVSSAPLQLLRAVRRGASWSASQAPFDVNSFVLACACHSDAPPATDTDSWVAVHERHPATHPPADPSCPRQRPRPARPAGVQRALSCHQT